jgi:hypothetical protein
LGGAVVGGEGGGEGAGVGDGEPDAEDVAAFLELGVVFEFGAAVEGDPVVEEEDVAGLLVEADVEFGFGGDGLEEVEGFDLLIGEVREIGVVVGAIDEDAEEGAGEVVFVEGEDGLLAEGELVSGIDGVAFVGEGLHEDREEVGAAPGDFVVEGEGADEFVFAAGLGLVEAEEGDDVAAVGVEGEFFAGAGAAGARVVVFEAFVADGEDAFALGGLGEGGADVLGETEEEFCFVFVGIVVEGKSADKGGAGADFEVGLDAVEFFTELGEGELLGEGGVGGGEGLIDLGDIVFGEGEGPIVAGEEFVAAPGGGAGEGRVHDLRIFRGGEAKWRGGNR